jgi:hypothetical protein
LSSKRTNWLKKMSGRYMNYVRQYVENDGSIEKRGQRDNSSNELRATVFVWVSIDCRCEKIADCTNELGATLPPGLETRD